ncbi:MAG: hypothetical protein F4Y80_01125 [Caldilineaceae bacterium SB0665_bin_21]|nr:hypothetical protein [Caldilineaceae bacterium SB0665_bin_21]
MEDAVLDALAQSNAEERKLSFYGWGELGVSAVLTVSADLKAKGEIDVDLRVEHCPLPGNEWHAVIVLSGDRTTHVIIANELSKASTRIRDRPGTT